MKALLELRVRHRERFVDQLGLIWAALIFANFELGGWEDE